MIGSLTRLASRRGTLSFSSRVSKALGCRYYSPSKFLWKDRDNDEADGEPLIVDEDLPEIQTLNADHLSLEEIEKILQEEEERMKQEEKEKFVENWKPGLRKRPLQVAFDLKEFEYELEPEKHGPRWTHLDKRCGMLGIKVGMMPVFDDWGVRHPCTVLSLDTNIVMGHKTLDKHGYLAVQLAAGQRKAKNVGKSVLHQYAHILERDGVSLHTVNNATPVPYIVREFRVSDPKLLIPVGSQMHASHFVAGQKVDVSAISKGKGFQGAMKRHGFKGMPASHGVSKSHRALGSTGQCQDPGRVFKGKKMAGRMGGNRVTTQNLTLLQLDRGRNLLYVKGAIPGPVGRFVEVRDAIKKPGWGRDLLADMDRPPLPTFEYDPDIDGSNEPYPVFMPLPLSDPLVDMSDEKA